MLAAALQRASEPRDLANGRLDFLRCAGYRRRPSIFRPISTGGTPEASRAICSAARWRGSRCGYWRDPFRRLQAYRGAADHGCLFSFTVPDVDDIYRAVARYRRRASLQRDKGDRGLRRHHRSRAQRRSGEGYGYEAMVRNFEHDAVGLIANNPRRRFRHLFSALFDPAIGGDAGCLAGDTEDRL